MINNFLIVCSGADREILEQCPLEKAKFISIGMFLLLTSLTMSLAVTCFFPNFNILAAIVSCSGGLLYFSINRSLIISVRSATGKYELVATISTILMALVFTMAIWPFISVKIFRNRIKAEYSLQNRPKGVDNSTSIDVITEIEILRSMERTSGSIEGIEVALFLMILLIQCSPIIIVLLSKKGLYEIILQRREEEDRTSYEIVASMRMKAKIEIEELMAERELRANEGLLNDIATKQAQLAKMAIDNWYDDEVSRIKAKKSPETTSV